MAASRGPRRGDDRNALADAAALEALSERLSDLLTALRDTRGKVHHPALQAVLDDQIDRQLAADTRLREAILQHTGRPVNDPY